jgi:hypothetical protein
MNELTVIRPNGADVDAYRASTEAANLCKEIVVATSSNIQGRRYVSVEGWQAIARAHGCAAGASHVERVDGGVRAVGEVRDILTGQLVAQAEGFVGEDEPTWFGGDTGRKVLPKRPDYAIRAMAQTRAMSRACRSAFAHVVVMMNAGLATTPAEEVPQEGFDPQTGEIHDIPAKVPGIAKIKARLNKLMLDGDKETDLEKFNALVHDCKDELTAIRAAKHQYWTGDGEDSEGFAAWIKRRRAELENPESTGFQFLMSLIDECDTVAAMQNLVAKHGDAIDALDGAEARRFQTRFDEREAGLAALDKVTAGA